MTRSQGPPRPPQPPRPPRPDDSDDDPVLREMFAALREEDRRALPRFDRLLAEARAGDRRGGRWLWVGAGALSAVVVAVVMALVIPPRAPRTPSLDEALAMARAMDAWEAPTDSMLEIALLKVPDTVPTLEYTSIP